MKIQAVAKFLKQGNAPIQEDYLLSNEDRGIFVAADGFGGKKLGSSAAKSVCDLVLSYLEKEAGDLEATLPFVLKKYYSLAANVIFNAMYYANQQLQQTNSEKSGSEKGGCSAVAGFVDQDVLALASVGSCTSYLIRNGKLTELTQPRTYEKLLNPFSARLSQRTPLMCMGLYDELEPEIIEAKVRPGDWLILGTQPLSQKLKEELMIINQNSLNNKETVHLAKEAFEKEDFSTNSSILLNIF